MHPQLKSQAKGLDRVTRIRCHPDRRTLFAQLQEDVQRLQGSLMIDYTLATVGAEKLWKLMHDEPFVPALGALTGNQAMQQIRAGLKAVYCSGWQVRRSSQYLHWTCCGHLIGDVAATPELAISLLNLC